VRAVRPVCHLESAAQELYGQLVCYSCSTIKFALKVFFAVRPRMERLDYLADVGA